MFLSYSLPTVWFGACQRYSIPSLLWCQCELNTCVAITNLCSSTIFTITYHFNPAQIVSRPRVSLISILSYILIYMDVDQGLTHLSGLVGTIVGALITGPFNDWAIIRISQRNRGIYEPEFRLIFMLAMLFGVFGYAAWAVGIDHHMPWIGSVACIAYVSLCHPCPPKHVLT